MQNIFIYTAPKYPSNNQYNSSLPPGSYFKDSQVAPAGSCKETLQVSAAR
jgi:hypothetical protein